MRISKLATPAFIILLCLIAAAAYAVDVPVAGQTLRVVASISSADALLSGGPAAWAQIPAKRVALNRTPPLFDTDDVATLDIPSIEVKLARTGGKLLVQLTWKDVTHDAVTLPEVPNTPPETRFRKGQTGADDRFFDAAAVMYPSKPGADAISPSLQMGDAEHPVQIYFWNATRGAMLMEAQGRGTTKRTGQSFPANGSYENGQYSITFELPDLPAGTPVAFAVWNGSQKDRDGRKYFSVWQVLE
jgi:hypothetical protein